MKINEIIDNILKIEGSKYTNDPADRGGPTKYGITQRTLAAYRGHPVTPADVAALTEADARTIYYQRYVVDPGFDQVLKLSERIGEELVDSGVNCGVARAAEWLQRSLNVLNREAGDYPDIKVDADIGPGTLGALRSYLTRRGAVGETVMLRTLNALQGGHYLNLAERDRSQEKYFFGWLANRVS